jgi:hypothetical protein
LSSAGGPAFGRPRSAWLRPDSAQQSYDPGLNPR